jgi:hypothetical protein
METATHSSPHSTPYVDLDFVAPGRKGEIGIRPREGESTEPTVFEGTVEPPKSGLGMQAVHYTQPVGRGGGSVERR